MKIIIEQKINLPKIEEKDIEFFKTCSIFFKKDEKSELIEVIPQAVTLDSEDMEKFFDIIYFYTFSNIILKRYENARYKLIIED